MLLTRTLAFCCMMNYALFVPCVLISPLLTYFSANPASRSVFDILVKRAHQMIISCSSSIGIDLFSEVSSLKSHRSLPMGHELMRRRCWRSLSDQLPELPSPPLQTLSFVLESGNLWRRTTVIGKLSSNRPILFDAIFFYNFWLKGTMVTTPICSPSEDVSSSGCTKIMPTLAPFEMSKWVSAFPATKMNVPKASSIHFLEDLWQCAVWIDHDYAMQSRTSLQNRRRKSGVSRAEAEGLSRNSHAHLTWQTRWFDSRHKSAPGLFVKETIAGRVDLYGRLDVRRRNLSGGTPLCHWSWSSRIITQCDYICVPTCQRLSLSSHLWPGPLATHARKQPPWSTHQGWSESGDHHDSVCNRSWNIYKRHANICYVTTFV